ncbi:MAG: hypothetical protein HOV81_05300 [Kofleriaceae bacterium]|nr:hypothetical protein [Kofleriaceae bacterium]
MPGWCKGEDFKTGRSSTVRGRDESYKVTIQNVVEAACTSDPAVEPTREATEKLRREVSSELFMNDADWSDAVLYVKERDKSYDRTKISTTNLGALTPIDQYVAIKDGFVDGVGQDNSSDAYYRADAIGDALTETGRLGFLETCMALPGGVGARDDDRVVDWAICAEDAQKFDPKKVAEELRTDTAHEARDRTRIHLRLPVVMQGLAKVAAARDALFKTDEAYKAVFDVAQKGRDDWRKGVGTNTELLALVQSTESGFWFHSRKQFAGCEEKTQKAIADAASKIPAKLLKNLFDERYDPFHGFADKAAPILVDQAEFNLAATAYTLCQPKTAIGAYLGGALYLNPGLRGPRTAAFTAIFHQEFALDDTQLKEVKKPRMGARPYTAGSTSSFGGVLKSFTPGGSDAKGKKIANLQQTLIKQEECVKSHSTGRIARITPNGEVQYEQVCDKAAIVTHDHTWDPFAVSERSATWVKPGQLFSTVGANGEMEVIAVWSSKTAKQPSLLLGGVLK